MNFFQMKVKDTFRFQNGATVFVGAIESSEKMIPPCECEIVVGDEVKASLRIDGEMILEKKASLHRSISTSQPLDLAAHGLARSGFTIRSKAKQTGSG